MASCLTRYPPLPRPTYTNPQPSNMPRGGRYRGGSTKTGSSQRLKGVFADGSWLCNCEPRLPAVNFTVKKDTPNKGRNFYTCQQQEPKRCDFFLWAEDAQLREQTAVMGNSKSEPVHVRRDSDVQEGWNAGRKGLFSTPVANKHRTIEDDTPTPTPSPPPPASKKRKAHEALLEEDEAFPVSGDLETEMAKVANNNTTLSTPQKALKTGVYATPATTERRSARKIPWLEPITPASTAKKTVVDYFNNPTPSKRRVKFEEPEEEEEEEDPETPGPAPTTTIAPPASPSPARHRDALVDPADSASSLTNEVLTELSSLPIPPEKISSLRSILSKHDLRTQGVTRGRDISRLALKAKEAKIVELEARVASLEAEREHDRGMIARLRWKQDNGGEEGDSEGSL